MSVRLKRAAAAVLAPTGLLRAGGALKAADPSRLLLLGYHRVLPLDAPHSGDVELVSATPAEFAWQMEYVARRFEPVTFAQIADALDGRRALPARAIAVTFDDGFADVHEHAFPILHRLGMPATVFAATDLMDRAEPFWFDLVAWLVLHAPAGSVRATPGGAPVPEDASDPARRRAVYLVLKHLKSCDEPERAAAVAALLAQFPEAAARGCAALGHALRWEQAREMVAGGIEFGSHTKSHRCLAQLGEPELERELGGSKAELESKLGTKIDALAYPFGGAAAFDANVVAVARRTGYRVATTYMPGINDLRTADRFGLLRQHVERDTSRSYFEALVNVPELFD